MPTDSRVFKKINSKQTDPYLNAAISDLFEIITTCLTPNEAADIQRKAELLARVNLFMNDLSTVGNLSGALINVQVELINNMFYNLFHIAKTNPFVHQKVPVPALNPLPRVNPSYHSKGPLLPRSCEETIRRICCWWT